MTIKRDEIKELQIDYKRGGEVVLIYKTKRRIKENFTDMLPLGKGWAVYIKWVNIIYGGKKG